jgi:hypothetical protein
MATLEVPVSIKEPRIVTIPIRVRGTAPYCCNKMTQKSRDAMRSNMVDGATAKSKKKREPRDFDSDYQQTLRISKEGIYGIPAKGFRQAMTDACRATDMKMTVSKIAFSIEADGLDKDDMMPLVYITKGTPERREHVVKNANGSTDIRVRPFWDTGWEATVTIRYDADMVNAQDVVNLLARAGAQVGVGAGRPFSPNSTGMGWGTFEIIPSNEAGPKKGGKK